MQLKETRPWGHFEILSTLQTTAELGPEVKIKRLVVQPHKRLSYQSHQLRNERWVVVQGSGTVTLDGIDQDINEGDVVYVDAETKHRLANNTDAELVVVEVSMGICNEDDIIRYDDDFGRVS